MIFSQVTFLKTLLNIEKNYFLASRKCSQNLLNLSDPAVQKYLNHILLEHENLHAKPKKSFQDAKRLQDIKPIANVLDQRICLFDSIESLKDLNKKGTEDNEMKKMIQEEAKIYLKMLKEIDDELLEVLLEPQFSEGGVMLEVAAGAGGQEAMLFAKELFDMYVSYAKFRNWEVDIATVDKTEIGGIRKASMLLEGLGVPELMKLEAGVHRVQRIPSTEKGGRIHTSTVSVAVLPQPNEIELNIPEKDLVIETKRATGAGGQHVNTTDSAVRIHHVPSGLAVECQEGRSQIKNKKIALQKLRTLLLQKEQEEQISKLQKERKSQVRF